MIIKTYQISSDWFSVHKDQSLIQLVNEFFFLTAVFSFGSV